MVKVVQTVEFDFDEYLSLEMQEVYKQKGQLKDAILRVATRLFEEYNPDLLLIECSEYPELED